MALNRRDFMSRIGGLVALITSGRHLTGSQDVTPDIDRPPDTQPIAPPPPVTPAKKPLDILLCSVAGFRHHAGLDQVGSMRPGDPLQLEAEPDNRHDTHAVSLTWRSRKIGYLPRTHNTAAANLLAGNVPVSAQIATVDPTAPPWEMVTVRLMIHV